MLLRYLSGNPSYGLLEIIAWTENPFTHTRPVIYLATAITTPTLYTCYIPKPSSVRTAVSRVFAVAVGVGLLAAVVGPVAFVLVPIGTVVIAGLVDAKPAERPYALAFPLGVLSLAGAVDARVTPTMALGLFVLLVIVVPIVYDRLVDGNRMFLHTTVGVVGLSVVTAVAYLLTLLVGLRIGSFNSHGAFPTFREVLTLGPALAVGTAAPILVAVIWRRLRLVV
ncbi:hypothetical protein [Halorhabdus salina]|uniref:hypothetical protein n=1 Tax=Halorhabdus salina TaxID=2750670 RepID=UPI0015EEED0E|nr:hypothetical protein [Halorhabdus salina]